MFFKKSNTQPTAKFADDKLVLTLPDAMTPVVWMIDIRECGSFFMRVEKDDNGLYILQKIENSGKNVKIEDIAYYVDKAKASNAMMTVGRMLDKKDKQTGNGSRSVFGKIIKWFFLSLFIGFLLVAMIVVWGVRDLLRADEMAGLETGQSPAEVDAPYVVDDPDAIGVPMSADSYMEKQDSTLRLPF